MQTTNRLMLVLLIIIITRTMFTSLTSSSSSFYAVKGPFFFFKHLFAIGHLKDQSLVALDRDLQFYRDPIRRNKENKIRMYPKDFEISETYSIALFDYYRWIQLDQNYLLFIQNDRILHATISNSNGRNDLILFYGENWILFLWLDEKISKLLQSNLLEFYNQTSVPVSHPNPSLLFYNRNNFDNNKIQLYRYDFDGRFQSIIKFDLCEKNLIDCNHRLIFDSKPQTINLFLEQNFTILISNEWMIRFGSDQHRNFTEILRDIDNCTLSSQQQPIVIEYGQIKTEIIVAMSLFVLAFIEIALLIRYTFDHHKMYEILNKNKSMERKSSVQKSSDS
ncbi:hypothetical protein SSS_03114 [Sarcoptes scabiei]|uniref:Uncharacterized protein n=1 Tax=Sarcoptes scabiei TaxID=52283 RepID=A0A834REE6_SARSC|nr:hypothetical protein SSS_03114 [Sarcoptes scabiei]